MTDVAIRWARYATGRRKIDNVGALRMYRTGARGLSRKSVAGPGDS